MILLVGDIIEIDLSKVNSDNSIEIDTILSFGNEYISNTPIKKLDNVSVKGRIYYSVTEEVVIDVIVKGSMFLLDAVTLEEVDYPFVIHIDEVINENNENFQEYSLNLTNSLDIMSFLWQNIVLEVPIRVVKDENKDISLKGEGWELVDENTKKIDPSNSPFAALLENEGKE